MTNTSNNVDVGLLSDQEVVKAILKRNKTITYEYLYKKCYPLFKSVYNKYYTDCENCVELINDIYVLIMSPGKKTGKIPLAHFGFRCTLTSWLKLVAENHCKGLYKKRINATNEIQTISKMGVPSNLVTVDIENLNLNKRDVSKVIEQITPERYKLLIQYRYIDEKTNEETAEALNMTMLNYYNKHKLAKAKVINILKKEGLL